MGECVLKLYDELVKLNREKTLLEGTLFWSIARQRLKDDDGKKGFRFAVAWHVKSDEDYYSEEEIREEIERTRKQFEEETVELYDEDPPFEEDEE